MIDTTDMRAIADEGRMFSMTKTIRDAADEIDRLRLALEEAESIDDPNPDTLARRRAAASGPAVDHAQGKVGLPFPVTDQARDDMQRVHDHLVAEGVLPGEGE